MMLTRRTYWNPFQELHRIAQDLDRWNAQPVAENTETSFLPRVDIHEDERRYLLSMDLPGVSSDNVEVQAENNLLTIKGERKRETEETTEGYRRTERVFGSFNRSFGLPKDVNVEGISATHKNGVLTVTLPKKEQAKPKSIEIQTAN